ncbi:MAG TPA: COX15/CtaA family protein [Woeseiaceae bacterium]|jgi:cytochrome c oxidase assembly protein subunit 15|nr:COX15/CtaA family protein [Woeseiaceae bacterium]
MDTPVTAQNRRIARWLLVLCALVFSMVVLGGVTRLTGSGLSMADWRPIMGVLPPLEEADWERAFDLYRETPEFRQVNAHMDVHAFKGIFWLEYLHRLLGRLIGVVFILPFGYFLWKGYIGRRDWPRYGVMFLLGGLQGLLGWYMVASGLVDDPRVSQYRLTAHLISAFAIYAWMFWVALSLLHGPAPGPHHPWFGRTRALLALVIVTVLSGGFVAGLDAGLIYNTFPMMGRYWIPPDVLALDPWWVNLFENMATAQFDHRVLATAAFCAIVAYWIFARQAFQRPRLRKGVNLILFFALLQVTLGISTLLLRVPIPLAAAHQAVALALFTVALYLCHGSRYADAAGGAGGRAGPL